MQSSTESSARCIANRSVSHPTRTQCLRSTQIINDDLYVCYSIESVWCLIPNYSLKGYLKQTLSGQSSQIRIVIGAISTFFIRYVEVTHPVETERQKDSA